MLRFIHRSLSMSEKEPPLVYIERFRVVNLAKQEDDKNDYYAALQVITPKDVTVSA